jgi:predicted esterase YcpF (UPF0227 family)
VVAFLSTLPKHIGKHGGRLGGFFARLIAQQVRGRAAVIQPIVLRPAGEERAQAAAL